MKEFRPQTTVSDLTFSAIDILCRHAISRGRREEGRQDRRVRQEEEM
jgi:hypothetical protein